MSTAKVVNDYVKKHPVIMECLSQSLINLSSLSRKIMKEKNLKNFDAVLIALRRIEIKEFSNESKIIEVLKNSRLMVKTKRFVYVCKSIDTIDDFIHLVKGSSGVTFVCDKKQDIDAIISHENVVEINLISSPDIEEVPGVVSYIYSVLFNAGVNVIETFSSYTDTIIIINKKDLNRTVEAFDNIL